MLRYALLGGSIGPLPAAFFLVLGLGLGVASLVVFGVSWPTAFRPYGTAEAVGLALAGSSVLGAGLLRRRGGR